MLTARRRGLLNRWTYPSVGLTFVLVSVTFIPWYRACIWLRNKYIDSSIFFCFSFSLFSFASSQLPKSSTKPSYFPVISVWCLWKLRSSDCVPWCVDPRCHLVLSYSMVLWHKRRNGNTVGLLGGLLGSRPILRSHSSVQCRRTTTSDPVSWFNRLN